MRYYSGEYWDKFNNVYSGPVVDQILLPNDICDQSVEAYLASIKMFDRPAPSPVMKLVHRAEERAIKTKEKIKQKGPLYGPKLPTEQQIKQNLQRIDAEKAIAKRNTERRLSRSNGWDYNEVIAISCANFIKGIEIGMGDIPNDKLNEFVEMARNAAKKNIQAWQDFEVENYKKQYNG